MDILLVYLLIINAIGFLIMLADKYKAVKKKWRIPEKTLFAIALLGGSFGGLVGMYAVRHKTQHLSFTLGMPVILAVQILGMVILLSII